MIIEAFALATHRSFSPAHPLYRLLKPHMVSTMAINALARQRLLPQIQELFSIGNQMIPLIQKAFGQWTLASLSPVTKLEMNGFHKDSKSPLINEEGTYPWREDVLLMWDAITGFVENYVETYYKNDAKLVMGDAELANWRLELMNMLPGKEIPHIDSQAQVIELVSLLIYTATCGHSAVNFNQYEYYSYAPNHPAVMRSPIPEEIGKPITTQIILDALPNKTQAVKTIALARSLSEYSDVEVFIGQPDQDNMRSDANGRVAVERFRASLNKVTETIKKRNLTTRKEHPYVWLMPSMVTNSIAI
jgi:hypothetical protein